MNPTETPMNNLPSWAEMMQMVNKNSEQIDKLLLETQETARLMRETRMQMQETDRRMKETDEKYRELATQFTSTIGHIAEGIMEPAAVRMFQEAGFNINRYYRNVKSKIKNNQCEMELDLLMLDDTLAIAVEIKTDCRKKDIDHFLRQMPKFKRLFPEYRDKEVFVAVAALNYDRDAIHYAKEQGLLVISTADGDNFTLQPADCKTLKRF